MDKVNKILLTILGYIGLLILALVAVIVCSWGLVILVDWLFPDLYKVIDKLQRY